MEGVQGTEVLVGGFMSSGMGRDIEWDEMYDIYRDWMLSFFSFSSISLVFLCIFLLFVFFFSFLFLMKGDFTLQATILGGRRERK